VVEESLMEEYGDTEFDDLSSESVSPVVFSLPDVGAVVDGRYQVKRCIGEGGFGWVFEVEHTMLGQSFAMKILHTRFAQDKNWHVRFRQEARATSLIGHENIVFVTDFGSCSNYGFYFVMEYLDGHVLSDFIEERGRLDLDTVLRFALAASSALSAVHDLGIVHSDLKPGNVMLLERPGRPEMWKFLDFGTSNFVVNSIESANIYGTPAYMPPEQSIGADLDHRADQYSLGAMIYEMLTGELPYPTKAWSDALPENRRKAGWVSLSVFRDDLPEEVERVLRKSLELRRSNRFESIHEFVTALCSAANQTIAPTADPMDLRVLSTERKNLHVAEPHGFERSATAPRVTIPQDAGESMIIQVDDLGDEISTFIPRVDIVFQTVERLRREYRRNLIGGGIYVPSEMMPLLHTPVLVNLTLKPRGLSVEVEGRVVSHNVQDLALPVGFGVALDSQQQERLQSFLNKAKVIPRFEANSLVSRVREPATSDQLSAGEAFLLTRLVEPMRVGPIRQMLAGLPYEVDEMIDELASRRLLIVDDSAHLTETASATNKRPTASSRAADELGQVVELVDYFERAGNFLGAMDILRRGVEISPEKLDLRLRLARYYRDFRGNREAARREAEAALALDPDNKAVQTFLAGL